MKSFGAKLALWYALVSTATLVCLTVIGYYLLNQYLINGLDLLNEAEFTQIKASLGPDYDRLTSAKIEERVRRTTESASVLFYVEIHQRGEGVVFASSNLGDRQLPEERRQRLFNVTIDGLGELRVGEFIHGPMNILVATSLSQVREVMDGYAEISVVMICFMLLGSLMTGLALSHVAMRPVRLIRETANRIRSDNLSERIPVSDVQDEFSNLARLLNETFDRLESSFNQIRRFTAEASHELKTPLSLVRLQAEKLLVDGDLTPAQEEAVQLQLEEITRLNTIIEELLFLSRAEAQAIKPVLQRQDPRQFLQNFAVDARVLAEDRGVQFDESISGAGLVDFDPKWIRQVLLNLLTNSLNVSPRGCLVTLASEFTSNAWQVAVEDEGPGVPPEQRECIFERFVRLTPNQSSGEKGSGLGLAISRSIIGMHQGIIRAEDSSRGRGLRVVFEIPLPPQTPQPGIEVSAGIRNAAHRPNPVTKGR
ncbi:MAG: ATP-binding protein [Opitutaceae bacterium]|nr:ATP-binding protein [Opitutaceae bacterium]